jgi:hypothetical protein
VKPGLGSRQSYSPLLKRFFGFCKAVPGFFLCIFSSLTCLKKHVLSKRGLLAVEGTSQAVLGYLFLKSEKTLALLYAGKGPDYRPFSYT